MRDDQFQVLAFNHFKSKALKYFNIKDFIYAGFEFGDKFEKIKTS